MVTETCLVVALISSWGVSLLTTSVPRKLQAKIFYFQGFTKRILDSVTAIQNSGTSKIVKENFRENLSP